MSELYNLKHLSEDQIEVASRVVARAFYEDPAIVYCHPDPYERKIRSVTHCEYLILLGILSGEVFVTSSDIEGVAIWHAIDIKDQKMGKQSKDIIRRSRKVRRALFLDPLFKERLGNIEEITNSFQNEHVNFPHWYLGIIGVDPIHQGKGYGSKLVNMKLAEIDTQNLPCYLHTENERNVKFYERFGFELIGKKKVPNSDFYLHAMLRNNSKTI